MQATLESQVLIRSLRPGDCASFLSAVRRSRTLRGSWIRPKAKTRKEFTIYLKRFSSDRNHGYLVIHRGSGGFVGVINLNDLIRGIFQSAYIGYYAILPYAGQGLMHEGLLLVLKRAFGMHKLHRLEAYIQPANRISITLVQKCGFVREGLSRRLAKVRGRWKDHERWAPFRMISEDKWQIIMIHIKSPQPKPVEAPDSALAVGIFRPAWMRYVSSPTSVPTVPYSSLPFSAGHKFVSGVRDLL
jgi:ribosomal-protein-alanine N-acetyltransferase